MTFDPTFQIGLPINASSAAEVRSKIRAWITSDALANLIDLFGGAVPLVGETDDILVGLETFSDRWDFRRLARERGAAPDDALRKGQGAARWLSAATELPADFETRIIAEAGRLGLVEGKEPSLHSYDYMVVLGGARLSCKLRPERAIEVLRAGSTVDNIVLLGAARPVAESERDATDSYAPSALDEFDLIIAGARHAFGFKDLPTDEIRHGDANPNLSWVIKRFKPLFDGRKLNVLAMSAPSSDPLKRRANSADTIVFFLDHENVRPESKLLLITSQIYVPYVQLEALRTVALPRQLQVETIGFPSDRTPKLQGLSSASHYLQEIRSTIQAAQRFCRAYPIL